MPPASLTVTTHHQDHHRDERQQEPEARGSPRMLQGLLLVQRHVEHPCSHTADTPQGRVETINNPTFSLYKSSGSSSTATRVVSTGVVGTE